MITKDYQYLDIEVNSIEQKQKSVFFELRKKAFVIHQVFL